MPPSQYVRRSSSDAALFAKTIGGLGVLVLGVVGLVGSCTEDDVEEGRRRLCDRHAAGGRHLPGGGRSVLRRRLPRHLLPLAVRLLDHQPDRVRARRHHGQAGGRADLYPNRPSHLTRWLRQQQERRWRRMTTSEAAWPGGTCEAENPGASSLCGAAPTVTRLIVGCVHEHQEDVRLCGPHAASILRNDPWWCGPCLKIGLTTPAVPLAHMAPSGEVVRVLTN